MAQEELWLSDHQDWGHNIWSAQGLEWKSFFYESSMQDFAHDKIIEAWQEGDIGPTDIEEWAYVLGHVLGNRHAATTTRNDDDAATVIQSDLTLGGGEGMLSEEMQRVVARDLARLNSDFVLFQELVGEDFWTQVRP